MEPHPRYTVLDTLGTGAFATVYRGFDRDLGREVAIKQIHAQYLNDGPRLESYWKEAQLLARLDHPCVMTIFDIVRDRGWLVLELLEGSLQQKLHGEPIRLDDLRLLLNYMLNALHFLHEQGIIHGDIKPGNLLLDRNGGIKLGDFGIARRVHDDHGSVMKGTTRYIAPEVLSAQFGAVGPASDLYSLGFTAYELLCGRQFDQLFPELETFGRDPQMSWMMWHASRELHLPPIGTVLEGVPEDIARVVQKLTDKDLSKRYTSAGQALRDLRVEGGSLLPPLPASITEEENRAKRARVRQRRIAVTAVCASMLLSVGMLWPRKPEPLPVIVAPAEPTSGTITHIEASKRQLFFQPSETAAPLRVEVGPGDRVLLNDAVVELAELRPGDRLDLRRLKATTGNDVLEVMAWREAEREAAGRIESIDPAKRQIVIRLDDLTQPLLEVLVPETAPITLNGQPMWDGRALTLADVLIGDRVAQIGYTADRERRQANVLQLARIQKGSGTVISIESNRRRITIQAVGREKAEVFELHPDAQATLNGVQVLQGRPVRINDLATGDQVVFEYDAKLQRIDATRGLSHQGVVQKFDPTTRKLLAKIEGQPEPVEFTVPAECPLEDSEGRPLSETRVRAGDGVWIAHDSIDLRAPVAQRVRVESATDPRAWAILIGQRQYDDPALGALPLVEADIAALREGLRADYRIPVDQMLVQQDATRDLLEADITTFLQRIKAGSQLVVYFAGCGVLDKDQSPVLAVKDTVPGNAADTGLPLVWLLEQLESCAAREKLLLLDTAPASYTGSVTLPAADLARAVRRSKFRGPSNDVTIISACESNERNGQVGASKIGLFAQATASALAGEADANRDARVDRGEFLGYLKREMARVASLEGLTQHPAVFLPDATPPRLSVEAREAIVKLLGGLETSMPQDVLQAAYNASQGLAPNQPEPDLIYGLILLRANKNVYSLPVFERVRSAHPDTLVAHQAVAWQQFLLRRNRQGLATLEQMLARLPKPADGAWDEYSSHLLQWSGALRAFALYAADPPSPASDAAKLDATVIALGEPAKELYGRGVQQVRLEVQKLDKQMAEADEDFDISSVRFQRRLLSHYVKFDFPQATQHIKRQLEQ